MPLLAGLALGLLWLSLLLGLSYFSRLPCMFGCPSPSPPLWIGLPFRVARSVAYLLILLERPLLSLVACFRLSLVRALPLPWPLASLLAAWLGVGICPALRWSAVPPLGSRPFSPCGLFGSPISALSGSACVASSSPLVRLGAPLPFLPSPPSPLLLLPFRRWPSCRV